jgi:cytochrome c553
MLKRILAEQAGGCCALCGYDRSITNLHFHHVDPSKKSFEINASRGKALAAYQEEARKCVLVCANCHGEIEAGLIESPPAGATYADVHDCWDEPGFELLLLSRGELDE